MSGCVDEWMFVHVGVQFGCVHESGFFDEGTVMIDGVSYSPC